MKRQIIEKAECTGCGACKEGCPYNAIVLRPDKDGFIYPVIDVDKCVDCNKCFEICKRRNVIANVYDSTWIVQNRDDDIRKKSTSGGIFAELAKLFFQKSGYVYGAAFNEKLEVVHIGITEETDLYKLQTSKYVQSSTEKTFSEVKQLLEADKYVLYTGTPCQIAGLKAFLNREYDKLLCVDIICQGVPNAMVWKKHLSIIGESGEVIAVNFRDKTQGWKHLCISYEKVNGNEIIDFEEDSYLKGFEETEILRDSCYQCTFRGEQKPGDLTIGDCWGYEQIVGKKDDDKGTSIIMINSDKGEKYFELIKESLMVIKFVDRNILKKYNKNYYYNPSFSKKRNEFFSLIRCGQDKEAFSLLKTRDRNAEYLKVVSKWLECELSGADIVGTFLKKNKYKKIAIYGMGSLGQNLYMSLKKNSSIEVSLCIDSEVKEECHYKILSVSELSSETFVGIDVIIITPIHVKNIIEQKLKAYYTGPIIGLDSVMQ